VTRPASLDNAVASQPAIHANKCRLLDPARLPGRTEKISSQP
jgi:hypothetical protein